MMYVWIHEYYAFIQAYIFCVHIKWARSGCKLFEQPDRPLYYSALQRPLGSPFQGPFLMVENVSNTETLLHNLDPDNVSVDGLVDMPFGAFSKSSTPTRSKPKIGPCDQVLYLGPTRGWVSEFLGTHAFGAFTKSSTPTRSKQNISSDHSLIKMCALCRWVTPSTPATVKHDH